MSTRRMEVERIRQRAIAMLQELEVDKNHPRYIPKNQRVAFSCHGCQAENSGETDYCWKCGKDRR